MTRNICITAGDGHTGFLIAELILTSNDFKSKVDSVSVLCLHPSGHRAKELAQLGTRPQLTSPYHTNVDFQVLKSSHISPVASVRWSRRSRTPVAILCA